MKKNKLFLLAILIAAFALIIPACGGDSGGGGGGHADGTFTKTVLSGEDTYWVNAFGSTTENRYQFLTLADDMDGSGYITAVSFRYEGVLASDASCTNVTIKMGHTSLSALTNTYASNVEEGRGTHETVLDNAAVTIPAGSAGDFFTIDLDNSFYYNGVDNVIVEIVRTSQCTPDVSITAGNSLLAAPYDAVLWTTTSSTEATGSLDTNLPNMKFHFEGGDNTMNYGGTISNFWPFSDQLGRSQNLYLASEIDGSGPITGIAFQVGSTTLDETYTATVKLAHSTQTSLSMTWKDNYAGSPKKVANEVTFTVPAGMTAGEYFWIPIPDGSFKYDGTRNLLVEVDISAGSGNTDLRCSTITGRRTPGYHSDGDVATGSGQDFLPHIKLRFNGGNMDVITDEQGVFAFPYFSGGDYKTQFMFGAQQLGTGGPVTGISFRLAYDSVASDYPSAAVVLGHTANTVLSDTFADNMTDPTTVFTGTLSVPAGLKAGDWVNISVSGFTYDPTLNLVVEVTLDAGTATNNILATSTDVPGASGAKVGPRTNPLASGSSLGQSDIRFYLDK